VMRTARCRAIQPRDFQVSKLLQPSNRHFDRREKSGSIPSG
jgi:hypothetical protein